MADERIARFEERREELKKMNDEQLKARFWALCTQIVEPIVELARTHTSPSIERSVLLRMGIDSLSSHGVVDRIQEAGLLGKGAGHVVLKLTQKTGMGVREAAAAILENKEVLRGLFSDSSAGVNP
jgi:D-ornithine 4,5-aminomutase subunit alpha